MRALIAGLYFVCLVFFFWAFLQLMGSIFHRSRTVIVERSPAYYGSETKVSMTNYVECPGKRTSETILRGIVHNQLALEHLDDAMQTIKSVKDNKRKDALYAFLTGHIADKRMTPPYLVPPDKEAEILRKNTTAVQGAKDFVRRIQRDAAVTISALAADNPFLASAIIDYMLVIDREHQKLLSELASLMEQVKRATEEKNIAMRSESEKRARTEREKDEESIKEVMPVVLLIVDPLVKAEAYHWIAAVMANHDKAAAREKLKEAASLVTDAPWVSDDEPVAWFGWALGLAGLVWFGKLVLESWYKEVGLKATVAWATAKMRGNKPVDPSLDSGANI